MKPFSALRLRASAGGDPHWANVSLLLHGEGADGSMPVDSGPHGFTVTLASGSNKVATDQAWFGSSSLKGLGGHWTISMGSAGSFGSSEDFTIEYALRGNGYGAVVFNSESDTGLYWYNDVYRFAGGNISARTAPVLGNVWEHFAVSRNSGVIRIFINGSLIASGSNAAAQNFQTIGLARFPPNDNLKPNGVWWDELRITKGVGRYPSDFAVQTGPHPHG